jgi:CheY-like chemotaxis protein
MTNTDTVYSSNNSNSFFPLIPFSEASKIVLLVGHDPVNLLFAGAVLVKCGCILLKADGPTRAMELFEEYGLVIDLLIVDLSMPEAAGQSLAESLKRRNPNLPVLCIAAASNEGILPKGFCFIEKPFTVSGLMKSTASALHAQSSIARFPASAPATFTRENTIARQ